MSLRLAGSISAGAVNLMLLDGASLRDSLATAQSFNPLEFSSLDVILRLFLKRQKKKVEVACFGIAGPVINNEVKTTNLPWRIGSVGIMEQFGIARVILMNDIVAQAYGLEHLTPDKFIDLNVGHPVHNGNLALIAAGAGLGQALVYREDGRTHPYASEGGHADFAPGNQLEQEFWEFLYAEKGVVEVEQVLSFSGLISMYQFLLESDGRPQPKWLAEADDRAAAIIERGIAGKDDRAVRTLDLFTDCFASEAANLALRGMTLGGVYLAGAIVPQILTAFDPARFHARFVKKGKMEGLLSSVPARIILEEQLTLIGAASVARAVA